MWIRVFFLNNCPICKKIVIFEKNIGVIKMAKAKNKIGNKYDKLLVIEESGIDISKHKMWRCQCD